MEAGLCIFPARCSGPLMVTALARSSLTCLPRGYTGSEGPSNEDPRKSLMILKTPSKRADVRVKERAVILLFFP